MLSQSLQTALNLQLKFEIESAYLYLSMSSYCESVRLPGIASWLRVQWQEELDHAMKLFQYVSARGGRVVLEAVEKPPAEFASPTAIFTQVLEHEQKVTTAINKLYEQAAGEHDHATQVELQWFIREQVEEERSADDILQMLKMVGENGLSLLMVDRQLAQRTKG